VKVSIKDLREKIENKPEISPFHFPSWDFLYMRDIKKLEKWIKDFLQAFDQFEMELREKMEEAQSRPSEPYTIEILKGIFGE